MSGECAPRPVSSRKVQAGNKRGEDGRARDTRRCLDEEAGLVETENDDVDEDEGGGGNGAVKEKADAGRRGRPSTAVVVIMMPVLVCR